MAETKKYLRSILSESRRALSAESARRLSLRIQQRLIAADFYRRAKGIVLYASKDNEVFTDLILKDALFRHLPVFFPRVDSAERGIHPFKVRDGSVLRSGAFGVLEPGLECEPAGQGDLSGAIVVIPGAGFGRGGERLGRGGGHYDRLLDRIGRQTVSVGLSYSFQLLERLPQSFYDRRVDFVVTEFAVHRAATRRPVLQGRANDGGTAGWTP